MDIAEKKGQNFQRHPWELARTNCFLGDLDRYLGEVKTKEMEYMDIGAGDMYFDEVLLSHYNNHHCTAVDIGYKSLGGGRRY